MRNKLILTTTYFLICLCVYSAHNYMISIIVPNTKLSLKQYSILDILMVIKFCGAFFWTYCGDRTGRHGFIIIIGLLGYAGFFSLFRFAPSFMKANHLNVWTYLYRGLSIFFLSSVFATMDTLVLEYLESTGDTRLWYGRIKIGSSLGHIFAHILVGFFAPGKGAAGSPMKKNDCNIYLTIVFAVVCSIFILFSFAPIERTIRSKMSNKKIESLKAKIMKNIGCVNELLTLSFYLLLFNVALQGIHRQSLTTYMPIFLEESNIDTKAMAMLFAVRCLPEIIMLFLTPFIEDRIGIYWMLFLGMAFGVSRPLAYSLIPLKNCSEVKKKILVYFIECPKGIFSALFGYASSKIVKEISTPKTRSLAQGVLNGVYSGLAPCVSGIIGYFILESNFYKIHGSSINTFFFVGGALGFLGLGLIIIFIIQQLKTRNTKQNTTKDQSLKSAPI